MSRSSCEYEEHVRRMICEGNLDETMRSHLGVCETCREVEQVTREVQMLARTLHPPEFPDAHELVRRFGLLEKNRVQHRASRFMLIIRTLAVGLTLFTWLSLVAFRWESLYGKMLEWFGRLNISLVFLLEVGPLPLQTFLLGGITLLFLLFLGFLWEYSLGER